MPKLISASMLGVVLLLSSPVASVHAAPTAESTAESTPQAFAARKKPAKHHVRKPQTGKASYYANRFNGRRTASGHLYYQDAYTAAHRTLPLGTWVKVTNIRNQRSVVVQITDRGPYADASRIIDLSQRSASDLEMRESGVVPVRLEVMQEYIKPEA